MNELKCECGWDPGHGTPVRVAQLDAHRVQNACSQLACGRCARACGHDQTEPRPTAYFFGCWGEPGHYMHHPGGRPVMRADRCPFDAFNGDPPLDGGIQPRRAARPPYGVDLPIDGLFCAALAPTPEARRRLYDHGAECPQGEYVIHHLRGHTLMAWWDRTQGDTRGACNSTYIVEGDRTPAEMAAAFPVDFPLQARRLRDAGIELRLVGTSTTAPDGAITIVPTQGEP